MAVRWILELDPDFPGPATIAPHLVDPVLVTRTQGMLDPWPAVEPPFVAYGPMRTMTRMLRHPSLAAAVFDHYPSLRCSSYLRAVYDLLGRAAFIAPMMALEHLDLGRFFGDRVFVRPDSNFKLFASGVFSLGEARRIPALFPEHRDELVVLSEVVDLREEYRCFCRKGRVVCHSSYPAEPYRPAPAEVIAFAESAAQRLLAFSSALRMVTIDVAASPGPDGGARLRLVEIGGVNSWGVYGADPGAFIAAMEAEALFRHAGEPLEDED